ncbi:MAG: hypothetical protein HOQ00_00680, partial [Agromyces sp.]|nr:hypothetical protein [Agromyces sp.]
EPGAERATGPDGDRGSESTDAATRTDAAASVGAAVRSRFLSSDS